MNVILTQPVVIALRTLSDNDRQTVSAWLDHLKNWECDPIVWKQSQELAATDGVNVLHAGTEYRIFFKLQPKQITVRDIATKETLNIFAGLSGGEKP
jgi:hypothetical protein